MHKRIFVIACALALGATSLAAAAQGKKRIEKAADMPRFTYTLTAKVEDTIRNPALFAKLAAEVRRDIEGVLAGYEIADKAAERQQLGVLAQIDWLEGRYGDAAKRTEQIRALQEKPADKLLYGIVTRGMLDAQKATGSTSSEAYLKAVGASVAAELKGLPYDVVSNDVKSGKARFEIIGETLVMGGIREVVQPTVDKSGSLSSDLAPRVIGARYALVTALPLKQVMIDTYSTYLAANKVDKPDIWAARNVDLPAGKGYATVPIAVWDSGVDAALFADRTIRDAAGKPALIAFDRFDMPTTGELHPIPEALRSKLPTMMARSQGFSDLQANIDSPEASEVKKLLSGLAGNEYKGAIEEISLMGNYEHGTHVAGIAMAGNPYARLAIARIEFQHTLLPDPCPSRRQVERAAKNSQAYVDFFRKNGVRVVNMSWGGSVRGFEVSLQECGIGKSADERKALAREYFDLEKNALTAAFASAPDILFVTSAGNSNENASFAEAIPSSIVLPNLITVGAVDKAGDEAPFTSYGPTVAVHANGFQVESVIPGGRKLALSGTSMSSPQVTNLAAKLLALNPKLKPAELIALIRDTADRTADGRRVLMNPAKAIAAVAKQS